MLTTLLLGFLFLKGIALLFQVFPFLPLFILGVMIVAIIQALSSFFDAGSNSTKPTVS